MMAGAVGGDDMDAWGEANEECLRRCLELCKGYGIAAWTRTRGVRLLPWLWPIFTWPESHCWNRCAHSGRMTGQKAEKLPERANLYALNWLFFGITNVLKFRSQKMPLIQRSLKCCRIIVYGIAVYTDEGGEA